MTSSRLWLSKMSISLGESSKVRVENRVGWAERLTYRFSGGVVALDARHYD